MPSALPPTRRVRGGAPRTARGFTVVELAITLGIASIVAAMALPSIDFNRMRMDASARLVENQLRWAQSRAVQRNMPVLVEIAYDRSQLRIVDDSTGSGAWESPENRVDRTLVESMRFVTPPSTIDGVTPYYATGAGVTLVADRPVISFFPNGSSSGDAVIYLGSPRARAQDNRAIRISGATSKMSFYRMGANGIWGLSEM